MSTPFMITALLAASVSCAHLGRTIVQLALSYLALRHSKPAQRKEILQALTPAIAAVGEGDKSHTQPATATERRSCRARPTLAGSVAARRLSH